MTPLSAAAGWPPRASADMMPLRSAKVRPSRAGLAYHHAGRRRGRGNALKSAGQRASPAEPPPGRGWGGHSCAANWRESEPDFVGCRRRYNNEVRLFPAHTDLAACSATSGRLCLWTRLATARVAALAWVCPRMGTVWTSTSAVRAARMCAPTATPRFASCDPPGGALVASSARRPPCSAALCSSVLTARDAGAGQLGHASGRRLGLLRYR